MQQRHTSDNRVNNRLSSVLRDGKLVEERWHKVVVGDIIKMENDQFVAADILLLSTSEPNSLCYIETAELDGETNLKVRQAIPETAALGDNIEALSKFNAELLCEPPNNRLSRFEGNMKWNGETHALDNEKMMLRGCVLRNTKWCYGVVVFAGKDTKLMMNTGQASFKRTHIDRLVNILIIGILIFLFVACLLCMICCGVWETLVGYGFQSYLPWAYFVPGSPNKDGTKGAGATVISLLVFFSYIIILNTVVPISLYVSIEIIRFGNSWMINWDEKMYYEKNDTPARARTTTLNEELGQIEYIFSDKTGTLTQNIMTFNQCSIKGKAYGDPVDDQGNPMDITVKTPKVDFSWNKYWEKNFTFYDGRVVEAIKSGDEDAREFFRLLSLCHTVMSEQKDGTLIYQAQSPDEGAMVSAARNFGYVFVTRTPKTITVEELGKEEVYELLCILDFNNVRKRMSVIVRKDDKIMLYCKGADSLIYERLDPSCADMKELTTSHLNDYGQEGLRTLCLSCKEIDPSYYEEWKKRYHEASISLEDREEKVSQMYEEIEENMILLGATAVEDKLQDGVPQCIANLALAGIKIWVLTGDKQETAINIGYSCRLLTEEMEEVYVVDGETFQEVEDQLRKAKQDMDRLIKQRPNDIDVQSYANGMHTPMPETQEELSFAIVINGHSLVHGLTEKMELLLLDTACLCKAVICCRVTPLQKAMVVELVKKHKKTVTLAIGDGANDVSMIKSAHIGIGISGQEGMQAVLSSDYSIAQFRFLERLLLVHGRWSYLRMCKFMKYFFYKNFAFTLCHFWYAFFCGFSAQTLYDPSFISLYNLCYTSLPVLVMGVFDQDVSDDYSLRYPKLYTPGHLDLLFNKKVFLQSVGEGVISSLILFFIPYGALNNALRPDGSDLVGHKAFGVTVASILIVAVSLRCALDTSYWTGFNHLVIWGSILFYFGFTFLTYADFFDYEYVGTARNVMSTGPFWFTLILTVTILLVPVVAERFYYIDTRPTLTDKVRLKQKISKSKSRSGELILRRQSTMRRSTRSLRSGYAFSHAEGFGNLITSGTNMRLPNDSVERKRNNKGSPPKNIQAVPKSSQSAVAAAPKNKKSKTANNGTKS